MEYLTKENIIIVCLILIIIYIILDKYKTNKKEHFTDDEVLNKLSSIINDDNITFNNVYVKGKLTAPTLYTRHILTDKDKTHKTMNDNKLIDGNNYIDILDNLAVYGATIKGNEIKGNEILYKKLTKDKK